PSREGEARENRTEQSWRRRADFAHELRACRGSCVAFGRDRTVRDVILPDYLAPGLRVVFCGTTVGERSGERGHYYAGAGNEFWKLLFESGLTPLPLRPEEDSRVLEFEIGLTDLAKHVSASSDAGLRKHYDVDAFIRKIEEFKPRWVAFHGKEAAKV